MDTFGLPAFPHLRRRFTQIMVDKYGRVNEDRNLIHYDAAAAQRAGFLRPVVHGALIASLISEACRDYFGQSWLESGQLKVAFIKPVLVEQSVGTRAEVQEVRTDANGSFVDLEVWCENEAGERVLAGSAACRYDRP